MDTSPLPAPAGPAAAPSAAAAAERQALARAAQAFEALMLEKLLAAAAPDSGPDAEWRSFGTRAVAADLARGSPLGIAKLLEKTK